jgi:hypothetical protein
LPHGFNATTYSCPRIASWPTPIFFDAFNASRMTT